MRWPKAEAAGRLGQVDVEPVTADVEAVGEAAEQARSSTGR